MNVFHPACGCGMCTCGGVKALNDYFQMEYVMSFLMGLNESFSQVRGQLLLLDPLPPINKVYSLIALEERQRSVSSQIASPLVDSVNNTAFAFQANNVKSGSYKGQSNSGFHQSGQYKGQRKDKPFCTYCNFSGHTVDRCYKLHGYPLGYKQKSKSQNAVINQVSSQVDSPSVQKAAHDNGQIGTFIKNLNSDQYQQLMTVLSNHLLSTVNMNASDSSSAPSIHHAGICFSLSLSTLDSYSSLWILDFGASTHICSNANFFVSLKPIQNSLVTLPNGVQIPMSLYGDVQLSADLVLKDVLFIPNFKFNLISVAALTTDSQFLVHLFPEHFLIQD